MVYKAYAAGVNGSLLRVVPIASVRGSGKSGEVEDVDRAKDMETLVKTHLVGEPRRR